MMKKMVSAILSIYILLSLFTPVSFAAAFETDSLIELEKISVDKAAKSKYTIKYDDSASMGRSLYINNNGFFTSEVDSVPPDLKIEVDIKESKTYYIWLRYQAPSGSSDSLYISLNDTKLFSTYGTVMTMTNSEIPWRWQKVKSGRMEKGINTVNISHREFGLSLDALYVTADASVDPNVFEINEEINDEEEIAKKSLSHQILEYINVLPAQYSEEKPFTKAQTIFTIMSIIYPGLETDKGVNEKIFDDVDSSNAYYSYIKAAYDLNIISGDGNNKFNPDKEISLSEACVMVLNAFNYKIKALEYGGYPSGYLRAATELGIIRGVVSESSEALKGEAAFDLFFNILNSNILAVDGISDDGISFAYTTDTYLSKNFKLYKYNSTVISNGISSLISSPEADMDTVSLRDEKTNNIFRANVGDTDIADYLGCRLDVYVKSDDNSGKNEVIAFSNDAVSKEMILSPKDIIGVNGGYIEYEKDKERGNTGRIRFDINTSIALYNGSHLKSYDLDEVMPLDGKLQFIDNDGDSKYDLLKIISFNYKNGSYKNPARNVITDIFDEEQGYINCMLDTKNNLNLNKNETIYRFVNSNSVKSINDLRKKMVLSIAECPVKIDGKTFYYIYVSNKKITSYIESTEADKIQLKEGEYTVSSALYLGKPYYLSNISHNKQYEILLDSFDNVAYVKSNESGIKHYGYVDVVTKTNDFEPKGIIRIFNDEQQLVTFELAEKVFYEKKGNPVTLDKVISDLSPSFVYENGKITAVNNDNLIMYSLNDYGQVEIIYPANNSRDAAEEQRYALNLSKTATGSYMGYKVFAGINVNDTILFNVARDDITGRVIEDFSTIRKSLSSVVVYNNIRFYNAGLEKSAKAALVTKITSINSGSNLDYIKGYGKPCILQKIVSAVNSEGESGYKLYYYNEGAVNDIFVSQSAVNINKRSISYDITGMKPGDVFIYEVDGKNNIRFYTIIYSHAKDKETEGLIFQGQEGTGSGRDIQIYRGTSYYKDSSMFTIKIGSGNDADFYPFMRKGSIGFYRIKASGVLVPVTEGDIYSSYDDAHKGSNVLVVGGNDAVTDVLIFD